MGEARRAEPTVTFKIIDAAASAAGEQRALLVNTGVDLMNKFRSGALAADGNDGVTHLNRGPREALRPRLKAFVRYAAQDIKPKTITND